MRKFLYLIFGLFFVCGGFLALYWYGAKTGWLGVEHDGGKIAGKALPPEVVKEREDQESAFAPQGEATQILFGDLHVHTTFSADAFMMNMPVRGGKGLHPVADACDFARYCSALDFWSINDHAESLTPLRWKRTKEIMRQCQAQSGDEDNPDLVSFLGFEWTQVGQTPADHYGHKNVIFKDLDDEKVSKRPIAASGAASSALRSGLDVSPALTLLDFSNRQYYFDLNKFMKLTAQAPDCDPKIPSDKLPDDCFESAATPGDLARKLFDEQKLDPIIIPHGSSWGFYTPAGSTWAKALETKNRPESYSLVEVFSGHGNSEEYRSWKDVFPSPDGQTATCPSPTANYAPSCWRAGEIIRERCLNAELDKAICDRRAKDARSNYANMGIAGHLSVPGVEPEDWLNAGHCQDCFLPAFNYRPGGSVQAGLAMSAFDGTTKAPNRFYWGMIGSSDNHRARAGTGYKQVHRRENTDSGGAISKTVQSAMLGDKEEVTAESKFITREKLLTIQPFQLVEMERQSSFWLTGGLAAVHAESRSRGAIWKGLKERAVYATSGQRTLLWFSAKGGGGDEQIRMGSRTRSDSSPTFEVKAVGAFKQKPGCPEFTNAGLDKHRLEYLCAGECYNPGDERYNITRIEVVKIRPQNKPGEDLDHLIQDPYITHECEPSQNGCSYTFSDPEYAKDGRDALYYVKAIQEAQPTINAEPIKCQTDGEGKCVKAKLCFGDYRSGEDECLAPAEHRAWSSPIYVDFDGESTSDKR